MTNPAALRAPLALALGGLCCASGWALAQHSRLLLLLPILLALCAVVVVFTYIGPPALWLWAPLAVITYPLGGPNANITFSRFWIPGLLAILFVVQRQGRSVKPTRAVMTTLLIFAAVLGIRTALTSGTRGDYAYGFRVWLDSLLLPVILFVVARRTVAERQGFEERIALSLMIAGLILAAVGIGERLFGFELASTIRGGSVSFDPNIDQVRISGPYEAPAPYGLALVLCLAATMYWTLIRPRPPDTLLLAVGVISLEVVAIFLNFFRVGWISAVLVIALSLGLRRGRVVRLVCVMAVVGAVLLLGLTQLEGVASVSNRINNTQNIYARLGAYEQAIDLFKTKPLVGIGALRYNTAASQLPPVEIHGVQSVPDPHSSLFEVLAEDGLVGVLALLGVAFAIWRLVRMFRRVASQPSDALLSGVLVGATLSYLIYSLTLEMLPYGPSNQLFALILGITAGRLDRLGRGVPNLHRAGLGLLRGVT